MEGVWFEGLPVAITVCDKEGIILEMNEKSCQNFAKDGGKSLVGKNILDCHPEKARKKIIEMLKNKTKNCYTIEKAGVKKMIYQSPWYKGDEFMGIVEFIFEIPGELPHFVR